MAATISVVQVHYTKQYISRIEIPTIYRQKGKKRTTIVDWISAPSHDYSSVLKEAITECKRQKYTYTVIQDIEFLPERSKESFGRTGNIVEDTVPSQCPWAKA